MASTYELIASQTLESAAASVTFDGIPQTFDDLVVLASIRSNYTGNASYTDALMQFNDDAGSNYPWKYLGGTGTGTRTGGGTGTAVQLGMATTMGAPATPNTFTPVEVYVPNYAGSSYKSVQSIGAHEVNATNAYLYNFATVWNNTSAITKIVFSLNQGLYTANSSFYLYAFSNS